MLLGPVMTLMVSFGEREVMADVDVSEVLGHWGVFFAPNSLDIGKSWGACFVRSFLVMLGGFECLGGFETFG